MVFTGPRTRLLSRALILVGILLFGLAPSLVSSSFLGFFEENVLLGSHLNFLRSSSRVLGQ